jgi:hypothetical protein
MPVIQRPEAMAIITADTMLESPSDVAASLGKPALALRLMEESYIDANLKAWDLGLETIDTGRQRLHG